MGYNEASRARRSDAPIPNTHRGALAGLTPEQRSDMIQIWADSNASSTRYIEFIRTNWCNKYRMPGIKPEKHTIEQPDGGAGTQLDSCATKQPDGGADALPHHIDELLALHSKEELMHWAGFWNIAQRSRLTKAELVTVLAETASKEPGYLENLLMSMSPYDFLAIEKLFDAGGKLAIGFDSLSGLESLQDPGAAPIFYNLPEPHAFLCYVFDEGNAFRFIMPDEVVACLKHADWKRLESAQRRIQRVTEVANKLAELRGILSVEDFVYDYQRIYDDRISSIELAMLLEIAVRAGIAYFDLLDNGSHAYLVSIDLADECDDLVALGLGHGASSDVFGVNGQTGLPIDDVLAGQDRIGPRPLDSAMIREASIVDWILKLPQASALTEFLDAHVPEHMDDHVFADDVMDELALIGQRGKHSASDTVTMLEDSGLHLDADDAQQLLALIDSFLDAVPQWSCNGWSASELADML